jgi:hypothetical protein
LTVDVTLTLTVQGLIVQRLVVEVLVLVRELLVLVELAEVLVIVLVTEIRLRLTELTVRLTVGSVVLRVVVSICVVVIVVIMVMVLRVVVGNKHVGKPPSKARDGAHVSVTGSPPNGSLQLTVQLLSTKVPAQSSSY